MRVIKMPITKKAKLLCDGCGCEIVDDLPDKRANELYGTKIILNLCHACKCTLVKELIESPHPGDFIFIKNLLDEEIIRLNIDLDRLGDVWKKHLGEPLTEERLIQHSDKPLSVIYLKKLQAIEECERVLKMIV